MAYRIDRTTLESVIPSADLVVLEGDALTAIPHEPTRAFLREVGLPNRGWLKVGRAFRNGEPEVGFPNTAAEFPELDLHFERWMFLGDVMYDSIAVDVATGEVYVNPDGYEPHLLNSSVDEFVYFLYLLEAERPNYDYEAVPETVDGEEHIALPGAEDRLREQMAAADPVAFETPEATWDTVLDYVSTKLQ